MKNIAEKMLVWKMDARLAGTAALLWCATWAKELTLEGQPWSLKQLYIRWAGKHGGSWQAVGLAIEDALAAAGVQQTNKGAICALVGYSLRSRGINTPEGWNSLADKEGVTAEN